MHKHPRPQRPHFGMSVHRSPTTRPNPQYQIGRICALHLTGAAGAEGVDPRAGWPGMPLWTGPLPLRAGRAGLRREWAEIQTWAGRPR